MILTVHGSQPRALVFGEWFKMNLRSTTPKHERWYEAKRWINVPPPLLNLSLGQRGVIRIDQSGHDLRDIMGWYNSWALTTFYFCWCVQILSDLCQISGETIRIPKATFNTGTLNRFAHFHISFLCIFPSFCSLALGVLKLFLDFCRSFCQEFFFCRSWFQKK